MNTTYQEDLQLIIYFNNTLSDLNTTYDKLFARSNENNVTQLYGNYGKYVFYYNYPASACNVLKFNRNGNLVIKDGTTIIFDNFVTKTRNLFDEIY